jgi:hypothetical protein
MLSELLGYNETLCSERTRALAVIAGANPMAAPAEMTHFRPHGVFGEHFLLEPWKVAEQI